MVEYSKKFCCKFTAKSDSKKIRNRLTFGEVMGNRLVSCFFWLTVYISNYTVSQKNKTLNSCLWLPQMLTGFQNSFTDRLTGKFATKSCLNIPPHLKYLGTLPCEIWMSENWQNLKYLVINDKSQGSIAKHLKVWWLTLL